MTFKKYNKSGQSVIEYVVLTTAVAAVVLLLATSPHFQNMQYVCDAGLDQVVQEIIK